MMAEGNGKGPPYKIIISQQLSGIVKNLHAEALAVGRGKEFLKALRQIIDELRMRASEFGEELYRLPSLRLLVRQGMIAPLVVDFAVHDEKPLVFVSGFKVLW